MSTKQEPTRPVSQSSRISKKEQRRILKEKQERNARLTRYGAIGVIALVVIGVIWLIVANQLKANSAAAAASGQTTPAPAAAELTPIPSTPSGVKTWASAPPMTIDKTKQYFATFTMAKGGQFVIQLYPDKAPIAVNSFVFLAQQGYFDGVTFHRVIEGFMAQGGDPTGTGGGGPGYKFGLENNDLTFDKAGVLAMANTGQPNSNGSQFFITFVPYPSLNGNYTIFGKVVSGMDVVNGLTRRDPQTNPSFTGDAIKTVTIAVK
jgi:peptidylprolyl isomerase